jgi:hypothetical protein
VTIRIGTRSGGLRLVISALSVDRVASVFFFAGLPRARLGVVHANRLGLLTARHIRDGLIPINVSPPGVGGLAGVGQTLTASPGTWKNKPTRFVYQWQRCDMTGANCASISGATAQAYNGSTADVGSTLRVALTARNSIGAATAISRATAVVPAAGPPVNRRLRRSRARPPWARR